MPKQYRGKTLWSMPNYGKGRCPSCDRTHVKLLWNQVTPAGETMKVCKRCKSPKND